MATITLDAKHWKCADDFYTSYCAATDAPKWFGRNLSALADSFRGGICKITAEKIVVRGLTKGIKGALGHGFWSSVVEICLDEAVELEIHSD